MWRLIRIVVVSLAAVVVLAVSVTVVAYGPMVGRCTHEARVWYAQASASERSPPEVLRQAVASEFSKSHPASGVAHLLVFDGACNGPPQQSIEWRVDRLAVDWWLRGWFTREELSAIFVSRIYMGRRVYGVDNAARAFYARELNALSGDELRCLVRKTRGPSRFKCNGK